MADRDYEPSKIGQSTHLAYVATAGGTKIRLCANAKNFKRVSFAIQVTTAVWIKQGASDLTDVTATTGMNVPATSIRWRLDVDSFEEAFLSILGASAAGTIRITRISDLETGDAPVLV